MELAALQANPGQCPDLSSFFRALAKGQNKATQELRLSELLGFDQDKMQQSISIAIQARKRSGKLGSGALDNSGGWSTIGP